MSKRKQYRNELIATADNLALPDSAKIQFILADIAASLKVLADASAPMTHEVMPGIEVGWIDENGAKHVIKESAFRDGRK